MWGDRFELISILGDGGMATVHLAHDTVRDERVALKVLHPHLARDPNMRARLRRELRAAGRIRHDAALVPHELHEHDGGLALSMPYHPGRTLAAPWPSGWARTAPCPSTRSAASGHDWPRCSPPPTAAASSTAT